MDRRKALKKTGWLAGAALTSSTMLSFLQSCKSEPRLSWKPEFFTEEEAGTIGTMVDMILPRTDTPGALDVKVDVFIDKVIAQGYDENGQQKIRQEIKVFNDNCVKNFGRIFTDLNNAKKIEVLRAEEKSPGKFNPGVWGTTIGDQEPIGFYRSLKSMAIWAYFTSEEIGKNLLNYTPIPGDYDGCIPLSDIGNRWS